MYRINHEQTNELRIEFNDMDFRFFTQDQWHKIEESTNGVWATLYLMNGDILDYKVEDIRRVITFFKAVK